MGRFVNNRAVRLGGLEQAVQIKGTEEGNPKGFAEYLTEAAYNALFPKAGE